MWILLSVWRVHTTLHSSKSRFGAQGTESLVGYIAVKEGLIAKILDLPSTNH